MSPRLATAFREGRLLRPSADQPDLVHLVRALAHHAGVPGLLQDTPTRELAQLIPPAEHLVFILLDGLGLNLLPASPFLHRHLKQTLLSTCPSTTACALTSVATGQWPTDHGVTGWFTHLPEFGLTCTTLPFIHRFTKQSLTKIGIPIHDVFPFPSLCPRMTHRPITLLPKDILNTAYAIWSRGDTQGVGYPSIPAAIDWIIAHLSAPTPPTYIHLYIPDIDTACHLQGVFAPQVNQLIQRIDAELNRLADALASRARIVITADHGLIDVPLPDQAVLHDGHPLLQFLQVPPTGDGRMTLYHLNAPLKAPFVRYFQDTFGDSRELIETQEIDDLRLLGPSPLSPLVRRRLGDYVALSLQPVTLSYRPPVQSPSDNYIGQHAGLTPDEMQIPLCVILRS